MTRYLMMAVVCSVALSACVQDQDTDTSEAPIESSGAIERGARLEEHVTFYSDASRAHAVGGFHVDCQGEVASWGRQTSYFRRLGEPCQQ
jgi:hypothetical protein